jgi:hypothetical protein
VTRAKKVVTVALVAFVTLVVLDFSAISPWGILIRPDPMWVGDNGVIEDMACDYTTVLKTATVFIMTNVVHDALRSIDLAVLHPASGPPTFRPAPACGRRAPFSEWVTNSTVLLSSKVQVKY